MKRRLLVHMSFVSVAAYLSEALYLLRGLILARLLGPSLFGVWAGMRLVLAFSIYAQMGSRHGMIQLAPRADGAGDEKQAHQWRQTAAAVNLIGAVVLALLLLTTVLVLRPQGLTAWWMILAGIVLLAHLFDFNLSLLRSQRRFGVVSVASVCFAAISTGLGILAAWWYGLGGFLVALAAAYAITLAGLVLTLRSTPRPRIVPGYTRQLVQVGLPIMLAQALLALLWNVDKLWIWIWRGSEALGIYSVQAYFTNAVLIMPAVVASVLHPHLMVRVGEQGEEPQLAVQFNRGLMALMQLSVPLVATVHLLLHLPIRWWLPEFTDAIAPGRVLMLGVYLSLLGTVPAIVLTTLGRQNLVFLLRLAALVLFAAAVGATVISGGSFVHIAIVMTAGMAVYGMGMLLVANRIAAPDEHTRWGPLLLPAAIGLLLVLLAWQLLPDVATHWRDDLAHSLVRAGLVLIVLLPLTWRDLRRA